MQEKFDILIRGGMVIDGMGNPPVRKDVGVRNGRIQVVDPQEFVACQVIAAEGCFVTPGFIDIHGHSDFSSLAGPGAASRVAAGITTECNGNCGYGAFPLAGEVLRRRQADCQAYGLNITWSDAAGYFAEAEAQGCAINRVTMIGHGNVRGCVMGYDNCQPTAAQMREMCRLVDECMAAGCAGLSSGLTYAPGMWAGVDELAELASVVAKHNGLYASHIRSEGDGLIESVREFLEVLRRSVCRGQLSHVKTAEPQNWHKLLELKELLHTARAEGVQVTADRYPYTASATDLATIVLPTAAREGTLEQVLARLNDCGQRHSILEVIKQQKVNYPLEKWCDNVVISGVARSDLRECVGRSISQLPDILGVSDPVEAAIRLIVEDRMDTQAIHFSMSEQNLREIYSWDFVAVGSDSSSRDGFEDVGAERPHPRAFGTPARFLDLVVRKWRLMDWGEAVKKLSYLPAQMLGIGRRGAVIDGFAADLVVLDPNRLQDRATYEKPCQAAEGIVATLVNGQVVWRENTVTSARPGRLLR